MDKATKDYLDDMNETLKDIQHSLNGNGQPGIKTRLSLVETKMKLFQYVGGIVGGAAILAGAESLISLVMK